MLAKNVGMVYRLELEISKSEVDALFALAGEPGTPAGLRDFVGQLFAAPAPKKPECFGVRAEIDARTEPCSTCSLWKDCVAVADAEDVDKPQG